MKRVGKTIQNARHNKGLTQTALAEKIDVSLKTIIDVENGKRNFSFDVLFKIVMELDIPSELIFRPDEGAITPEQEQFFREFRSVSETEQRIVIAMARSIWRELKQNVS